MTPLTAKDIPADTEARPTYLAFFRNGEFLKVMEEPDERANRVKSFQRIATEFSVKPISPATAKRLMKLQKK